MRSGRFAAALLVIAAAAGVAVALAFRGGGDAPVAVVLAAGDIAQCDTGGDEATAELIRAHPEATVLALGDLAYHHGTAEEFAGCYEPAWGFAKERTRPVPGNHEYDTPEAEAYFEYFGDVAGEPGRGYYAYDRGSWRLFALDSNCFAPEGRCTAGAEQLEWLRAEFAAHERRCVLAYWHHSRFSSGTHGSQEWLAELWSLLYDGGADVVLSAHDHDYERFAPQRPDGSADGERGLRQFVVGTGGGELRGFRPDVAPNSEIRNSETHGLLRLTLKDGAYEWAFLPAGGGTFRDSGSGRCH